MNDDTNMDIDDIDLARVEKSKEVENEDKISNKMYPTNLNIDLVDDNCSNDVFILKQQIKSNNKRNVGDSNTTK